MTVRPPRSTTRSSGRASRAASATLSLHTAAIRRSSTATVECGRGPSASSTVAPDRISRAMTRALLPALHDLLEPPLRRRGDQCGHVPVVGPADDPAVAELVDRGDRQRHRLAGGPLPMLDVLGHDGVVTGHQVPALAAQAGELAPSQRQAPHTSGGPRATSSSGVPTSVYVPS